jgi:acid phosphatase (class A)
MQNRHSGSPTNSSPHTRAYALAPALAIILLGGGATVFAQQPASAPPHNAMAPAPGPKFTGYLQPGTVDILKVLPPAPVEGDTRYETDRLVFKETRAWAGSARWNMASDDATAGPADMLRHFSCSVGIEMNPANAPKIMNVAQRATRDAGREMAIAKDHFQRKRPYWIDDGDICRPRAESGDTYDYPSGHTTAGWTWALVLAQVAPDRASQILARGRSIGESRVVCGVHNASAVEGGRYTADAVMAVISTNAEFRADVEAARDELAKLRKSGAKPEPARCEQEAALVALPITGKERAAH